MPTSTSCPRDTPVTVYRPTLYGKHCLLERISVGGMAEVFRARPLDRPDFDRFLVLKRILPHLAEDEEFVRMFVDEAKIAVQLHHRAVCQIYELGRLDGSFFIVMEHIAGRDLLQLQNWLRKRKKIMSVTQACFLAMHICEGLDYAHRKSDDEGNPLRIIHRDISPQNILISFDGEVKVIDFGIARAATTNQKTQVGVLKGKFGYMSPEQVAGDPLDHRSDVFAVGTLLWEMLTARRLFHADSDFATLEKVRSSEILPPSARNKRVPPEVDAIVLKALERNRDDRYAWASEMADALRAFLQSVNPPYDQARLADWMHANFPEEIAGEERKHVDFRQFVTADDVASYRQLHNIDASVEDADDEDEEATRVWVLDDSATGSRIQGVTAAPDDPLGLASITEDELASVILGDDLVADAQVAQPFDSSGYARPDFDGPTLAELRTRRRRWIAATLALVLVAVAGWLTYQNVVLGYGDVQIDVDPRNGVEILVDGKATEGGFPRVLTRRPVGEILVELRHPDYEPLLEVVEVIGGETVSFTRTLTPAVVPATRVTLDVVPPTAQVFVNGVIVGGMGATRTFTIAEGTVGTVEVYAPGHFLEVFEVAGEPDGVFRETIRLRGLVGDITVASEPAGLLIFNRERMGMTDAPIQIPELSILETYELEIQPTSRSFRPYRATVGFDTYYDLQIRPRLERVGSASSAEPDTWGRLTTGAPDEGWYRVRVDGRETGLVTPITEAQALPLKSGTRVVTFTRPGVTIDVSVEVLAGETAFADIP